MSLSKESQIIEIVESPENKEPGDDDIVLYEELPSEEDVIEVHDSEHQEEFNKEDVEIESHDGHSHLSSFDEDDDSKIEFEFYLDGMPGADSDKFNETFGKEKEEEEEIEVKEKDPWDWEHEGLKGFFHWLKTRWSNIPKHDGVSTVGVERAIHYLEKLDACISNAVRTDLDGILNLNEIEDIREKIDEGLSRLEERLEVLEEKYSSKRKKSKSGKKKAELEQGSLVKQANTPHIHGMYISIPVLISSIARTCINGSVSAGHDIEYLFLKQAKEFELTKREKAEVIQVLQDFGYPLRRDRLITIGEEIDEASSDNGDFAANFKG